MIIIVIFVAIVFIIIKVYSPKIKGSIGEAKVNTRLNFLGKEYIVLKDILISSSNGYTSQIDELVLSEYGIFVIETKNYAGSIYGKENSNEWYQYLNNKKFNFKNPIFQNYAHKKIVSKILKDEINVIPIVVFTTRCKLKVENGNNIVLYTSNQIIVE